MKFLLCFMMLFSGISTADTTQFVSVLASSCYVYEEADFETPITINEEKITLTHGTKLEVVEDNSDLDFIKVKVNNELQGYVYRYYVTYNDIEQEVYPVFNGYVIRNDTVIYDLDKNDSGFTAKENQGIYLYNGYNDKDASGFNAVAIVLENGSVYYGYMKISDIAPYGVNAGLITGIVVIISCLTIIFLLLFMKKTKRH